MFNAKTQQIRRQPVCHPPPPPNNVPPMNVTVDVDWPAPLPVNSPFNVQATAVNNDAPGTALVTVTCTGAAGVTFGTPKPDDGTANPGSGVAPPLPATYPHVVKFRWPNGYERLVPLELIVTP